MRLPVHLQRELARLHFYDQGQSNRAIARICAVSPGAVKSLREKLSRVDLNWKQLCDLDDEEWREKIGTKDKTIAKRKDWPDWFWVDQEMQLRDSTVEQVWRQWREACPDGIGYSQFAELYRKYKKSLPLIMRRIHRPGEKLFVDFAGRTVEVRDREGGPSTHAQIFVAVLGYSNFTFVKAVKSQTSADWIQCHVECFRALGGVPEWIVPDNLKAAVIRRTAEKIECQSAPNNDPRSASKRDPFSGLSR